MFTASKQMVKFLEDKKVNMQIRHMNNDKFIRNLSMVLNKHLDYRVAISPEQFI